MDIKLEDHCDEGAGWGDGSGYDEGAEFLDDYTFGTGGGYIGGGYIGSGRSGNKVLGQTANGKGCGDGTGVG